MTTSPLFNQLDVDAIRNAVQGCRRVLVRLPDGLLRLSVPLADLLSKLGVEAVISGDPCYGACDISENVTALQVDKVLFIGEAIMPFLADECIVPAAGIIWSSFYNVADVVDEAASLLDGKSVGLVSITPYISQLQLVADIVRDNGLNPVIGPQSRRTAADGQILGCDFTAGTAIAGRVDSFLYVGDGFFHPLGLALATKKPVVVADPSQNKAFRHELQELKGKLLKQRYAAIARVMDAQRIGIIVSIKCGQRRLQLARHMKSLGESHHRDCYLISADIVRPEQFDYLDMDGFVSTACPRVAIDDGSRFAKPLLTPLEFEIMLGERSWDNYEFDQIL